MRRGMHGTTSILRRFISACVAMTLIAIPSAAFAASSPAAGGMQDLADSLTVNSSVVAFGGRTWWVIGDANGGVYPLDNSITLLAKDGKEEDKISFREGSMDDPGDGSMIYHTLISNGEPLSTGRYFASNPAGMAPWTTPNEYAGSTLQQKMESVADAFSAKERALINKRTIEGLGNYASTDANYAAAGPSIDGQRVWSLSTKEVQAIGNSTVRSYDSDWWLRSSYNTGSWISLQVEASGEGLVYVNVDYLSTDRARPALSVNIASALFASSAGGPGDKSSAVVGGNLNDISGLGRTAKQSEGQAVKLTMKDKSQLLAVSATLAQSTQSAACLSFSYSGATVGANQRVSCILTDSSGDVKYYGKLVDSSATSSGNLAVPLAGVADGIYTLSIFSEEANDSLYADFCSEPVTMKVAMSNGIGTVSEFGGTVLHDHSWNKTVWNSDGAHHWHECVSPGCPITDNALKDGYAVHSGGEATYEHGKYCSVCGVEYTDPLPRPVVHRVTFDSNGGSAIEAVQVEDGNPVSEPAVPVREGYTFKGWYTDAQLAKLYDFAEPVTDDLTLYAKWEKDVAPEPKPDPEPVVHHVTFDSNGGTAVAAQKVEDGKTLIKPAAPTRDGHTFKGWFVDQQLTKPFDFADPVTGDVTLYAKWEKITEPAPEPTTHRVAFDANGGGAIANQIVVDGDPAIEPKDPVRDGYTFEGWYADEQLSEPYDFATPVTGDLTLYAKWEKIADADKDDAGKDDADKNDADKGSNGTGKTDGNATNDGKNNGGAADDNESNERKPEDKTGKRSGESILPQSGDASGSVAMLTVTGVLFAGAGVILSKGKNRGQ